MSGLRWQTCLRQALARERVAEQEALVLPEWMIPEAIEAIETRAVPAFAAIKTELERYGREVCLAVDAAGKHSAALTASFQGEQEFSACWRLYSWATNEEDPILCYEVDDIIAAVLSEYISRMSQLHGITLDDWTSDGDLDWREEFAAFMLHLGLRYLPTEARLSLRKREAAELIQGAAVPAFEKLLAELAHEGKTCALSVDPEGCHAVTLVVGGNDLAAPFAYTWRIQVTAQDDQCLMLHNQTWKAGSSICETFAALYCAYLDAAPLWGDITIPVHLETVLVCPHRPRQGEDFP